MSRLLKANTVQVDNARQTAQSLGVDIPLSEIARQHMDELCLQGNEDLDQAAMILGYESRMGVDVSAP